MTNWRGVVGYEDYYKVSDTGEIWSVRSQRKLATPVNKYRGYMEWTPKVAGNSKTLQVHQTVAQAFLGPANDRQVRHLNGNKLDNRLFNLAYGTALQNQNDRRNRNYKGKRLLTEQQKLDIKIRSQRGERTQALADEYKVSYSAISNVLDKKQQEVNKEIVWSCVQTGASITVIADYLGVTHAALSHLLRKHFQPMRTIRKTIRLNDSITVGRLQQLMELKK